MHTYQVSTPSNNIATGSNIVCTYVCAHANFSVCVCVYVQLVKEIGRVYIAREYSQTLTLQEVLKCPYQIPCRTSNR